MADLSQKNLQKERRSGADEDIHTRIGNRLKAYYDEVLTQPVPDRFEDLLRRLDEENGPLREQEKR